MFRLQQIDTQIDQTRNRLNQIESILNDHSAEQAAEQKFTTAAENLAQGRSALTTIETQAKDLRIKIQLDESNLYSGKIKNPKELQDIQNEIASLKKFMIIVEDRQLEAMMNVEEAEKVFQTASLEKTQIEGKIIEQNAQLNGERSLHLQNIERLQIERQAAEQANSASELEVYNHLRKTRNGVAVTRIIDRTCASCGFSLPPALLQLASSPAQLVRCTSCSRVLYPG